MMSAQTVPKKMYSMFMTKILKCHTKGILNIKIFFNDEKQKQKTQN